MTLIVRMEIPEGASRRDCKEFVREAVTNYARLHWGRHDDPLEALNERSVIVTFAE